MIFRIMAGVFCVLFIVLWILALMGRVVADNQELTTLVFLALFIIWGHEASNKHKGENK